MEKKDKVTFLAEKFNKEMPDGKITQIDGLTIMIDGGLKGILDGIIHKSEEYNEYPDLLLDAIFMGLNEITKSLKKED